MPYYGNEPPLYEYSEGRQQTFKATEGQTTFEIVGGYIPSAIKVYVDGFKMKNGEDVIVSSGTHIVFTQGLHAGADVDVDAYGYFIVADHYTKGETYSQSEADARFLSAVVPSFAVSRVSAYTSNQVVPYDVVHHNDGGHFNTTTKAFTAPVAGVYLFTWAAIGNVTTTIYRYNLRRNGSGLAELRVVAMNSEFGDGNACRHLKLNAGDTVDIHFKSDANIASYGGSAFEWFSGHLVSRS